MAETAKITLKNHFKSYVNVVTLKNRYKFYVNLVIESCMETR